MSMSLFWLIAMVLFGVLEAVTVGLTSIWFALGALGALAADAASAPVIVQIVVFLGVSFLTLLLACPLIILGRLRLGFWTLFLLLFCHGTLRHCRVCISGCLAV